MKNKPPIILLFYYYIAALTIFILLTPNSSANYSLLITLAFTFMYLILSAKAYKLLKHRELLKYLTISIAFTLFFPFLVLSYFLSYEATIFTRSYGFYKELQSYPLPEKTIIVDNGFDSYYSGNFLEYEAFIVLETNKSDEYLEKYYYRKSFTRAGPRKYKDDINPFIDIKRESNKIVMVELFDRQSRSQFF